MQRRVGQHHPEIAVPRRDLGQVEARRREHDRPRAREQQAPAPGVERDQRLRLRQVAHHQRERPLLAELPGAQRRDRAGLPGVARQVVAPDPLRGDDRAGPQRRRGRRDRIGRRRRVAPVGAQQPEPGAAGGAGHGLGVKAAVARVAVLARAVRAERPALHRRARAVVRQAEHDREARAAVGAVDVGVAGAAVFRIAEFGEAGRADREVRRNADRRGPLACARPDREAGAAFHRRGLRFTGSDPGRRRRRGEQLGLERVQRVRGPFRVDLDAPVAVQDPAGEPVALGETEDEGAEPYALHDSPDGNATRLDHGRILRGSPLARA